MLNSRLKTQLEAIGLPLSLHNIVCYKIFNNVFDAGEFLLFSSENGSNDEEIDGNRDCYS